MRRRLGAALAAGLMVVGLSAAVAAPTLAAPTPKEPTLSVTIADSKTPGHCVLKWRASNFPTETYASALDVYSGAYAEPYSRTALNLSRVANAQPIFFARGRSSGSEEVEWSGSTDGTFSAAVYVGSGSIYVDESTAVDLAVPNRCKP